MSKKHTASSAEAIPFDGTAAIAYAISCVPEYERKLLKIYQKDSDAYDQKLNSKDRFLQSALYTRLDISSQIHLRHIYSVFVTMTEAEIYAYIHKNCYRFVKPFQKEQSFETYQDAVYGSDNALSWQGIHVAILFYVFLQLHHGMASSFESVMDDLDFQIFKDLRQILVSKQPYQRSVKSLADGVRFFAREYSKTDLIGNAALMHGEQASDFIMNLLKSSDMEPSTFLSQKLSAKDWEDVLSEQIHAFDSDFEDPDQQLNFIKDVIPEDPASRMGRAIREGNLPPFLRPYMDAPMISLEGDKKPEDPAERIERERRQKESREREKTYHTTIFFGAAIKLLCKAYQEARNIALDLEKEKQKKIHHQKAQPKQEALRLKEQLQKAEKEIKTLKKQRDALSIRLDKAELAITDKDAEIARQSDYIQQMEEEDPIDAFPEDAENDLPKIPDRSSVLLFGGHPIWRKHFSDRYPNVRQIPNEDGSFSIQAVRNAEMIVVNSHHLSHKQFFRFIPVVRQYKVPILYVQ